MRTNGFEGRIRVRDEALKAPALVEAVREAVLALPGVQAVTDNRRIGSLLIVYDAAATNGVVVRHVLGRFLPEEERRGAAKAGILPGRSCLSALPDRRRMLGTGLAASFLLTAAGAGLHLKALHTVAGIVFSALAGIHLYDKRQALMP
jgi:hypothetical protein